MKLQYLAVLLFTICSARRCSFKMVNEGYGHAVSTGQETAPVGGEVQGPEEDPNDVKTTIAEYFQKFMVNPRTWTVITKIEDTLSSMCNLIVPRKSFIDFPENIALISMLSRKMAFFNQCVDDPLCRQPLKQNIDTLIKKILEFSEESLDTELPTTPTPTETTTTTTTTTTPPTTMAPAILVGPSFCDCPTQSQPVCSTAGVTIKNPCFAECMGLDIKCEGTCPCGGLIPVEGPPKYGAPPPLCICTMEFFPVCGADGNGYPNPCNAGCANVPIACEGPCPCSQPTPMPPVPVNATAPNYCPCSRDPSVPVVCSQSGMTIRNRCFAHCLGQQVACDGPCPCQGPPMPPAYGRPASTFGGQAPQAPLPSSTYGQQTPTYGGQPPQSPSQPPTYGQPLQPASTRPPQTYGQPLPPASTPPPQIYGPPPASTPPSQIYGRPPPQASTPPPQTYGQPLPPASTPPSQIYGRPPPQASTPPPQIYGPPPASTPPPHIYGHPPPPASTPPPHIYGPPPATTAPPHTYGHPHPPPPPTFSHPPATYGTTRPTLPPAPTQATRPPIPNIPNCNCGTQYEPLCAHDNTTQYNFCFAGCRDIPLSCMGACPCDLNKLGRGGDVCDCLPMGSPVCSSTGKTYPNECLARCDGDTVACQNACPCASNPPGFPPTKCSRCAVIINPVCGSDGTTYINRCKAECEGATVVRNGPC